VTVTVRLRLRQRGTLRLRTTLVAMATLSVTSQVVLVLLSVRLVTAALLPAVWRRWP
jgi:hypothetical protein